MTATIVFKDGTVVDVENLKEVRSAFKAVSAPYDNLLTPNTALTFVGDATVCCNSNDIYYLSII